MSKITIITIFTVLMVISFNSDSHAFVTNIVSTDHAPFSSQPEDISIDEEGIPRIISSKASTPAIGYQVCNSKACSSPLTVDIQAFSTDVTSFEMVITSDGGEYDNFLINYPAGQQKNAGSWIGSWQLTDTYNQIEENQYGYDIITTNASNNVDTDYIRVE